MCHVTPATYKCVMSLTPATYERVKSHLRLDLLTSSREFVLYSDLLCSSVSVCPLFFMTAFPIFIQNAVGDAECHAFVTHMNESCHIYHTISAIH